jgi:hypothetical protein
VKRIELSHSERHCDDLPFSDFLAHVRRQRPSQQQIDEALSGCSISEDQVIEMADEDTKVLCSHREQVTAYNAQLVRKFFPCMPEDAVDISPNVACAEASCPLEDLPDAVRTWASNTKQHALQRAAPMLRVMLTDAAAPGAAAAIYGAMARIEQLHKGGDPASGIVAISVRLDSDQSVHRLERSVVRTMKLDSKTYKLNTFPLRPCTVVSTPISTDANGRPELQEWLATDDNDFHALTEIAVGARAMVNKNISLAKGVSNGAPCVVHDIELNPDNSIKAIVVQMEGSGHIQRITRSATRTHCHDGRQ